MRAWRGMQKKKKRDETRKRVQITQFLLFATLYCSGLLAVWRLSAANKGLSRIAGSDGSCFPVSHRKMSGSSAERMSSKSSMSRSDMALIC